MMKRGHDVESAPSICRRRRAMEHYAGIDVSLEFSSVCVVDAQGKIVREVKVASEPEALVAFFASLGFAVKRVGLEAGPLSQWLHAGLKRAGPRPQFILGTGALVPSTRHEGFDSGMYGWLPLPPFP